jgi:hypothetical protein
VCLYKLQPLKILQPDEKGKTFEIYCEIQEKTVSGETTLNTLVISDAATFHPHGKVDRHNNHICRPQTP